jgi:CRISPR-associated protein Cmr6
MKSNYNSDFYLIWLRDKGELPLHRTAGFVEYLRWMRKPEPEIESLDKTQQQIAKEAQIQNNITKAQVLQKVVEGASHYADYFKQRNRHTVLIAGEENTFLAECAWRTRVGGIRGPEALLLPAFDARGMPYIPSSTLRGVARSQGLQVLTQSIIDNLKKTGNEIAESDWDEAQQQAQQEIATHFGDLEVREEDRTGKVIFLDAYPCGKAWGNSEKGLAIDMANSIWGWNDEKLSYQPNPNLLLSLRKPKILIGLRPGKLCDRATFEMVKTWLIQGLQLGIGSQVNTGYGEMIVESEQSPIAPFLQVNFSLAGQLIHSYQKASWNDNRSKYEFEGEAEVRPTAFKSMLRYWFRTWTQGVLPVEAIRDRLEPQLFGSIQPQTRGWMVCRVEEISNPRPRMKSQEKEQECLQQQGILKLSYSPQTPESQYDALAQLFNNLTWLMFHLGGIGQGARRPLYSRKDRPNGNPPWYRGCQLRATGVEPDGEGWQLPDNAGAFKQQFQERLQEFYSALQRLAGAFDPRSPLPVRGEALGQFCRIAVCAGDSISGKPFALGILHQLAHLGNGKYDRDLCGDANGNPSPIWIADLGQYQVVTVFNFDNSKRRNFLDELQQNSAAYELLWDNRGLII